MSINAGDDDDSIFASASSWWLFSGVDERDEENVKGGFVFSTLTLCGDNYLRLI